MWFLKLNPFKKSVASVMAGFQKVVNDLHAVAEHHNGKAEKHNNAIDKLLDKIDLKTSLANAAEAEAQAALHLAEKIAKQFNLN